MGHPTYRIVVVSLIGTFLGFGGSASRAVAGSTDGLAGFEELAFEIINEPIRLSGTLTLPSATGPHPCVVLLAGSGAQLRDSDALGFKMYQVLAHYLAQQGIASLRYDKRGAGQSGGSFEKSTLSDFADDAVAAVHCLAERGDIDPDRIGLCGHSEGGWVGALATTRLREVDFLVLLSTFALSVEEADRIQAQAMAAVQGTDESEFRELQLLQERIYRAARSGQVDETLKSEIRKQVVKGMERLPEDQRPPVDPFVQSQIENVLSPSFRYLLDFDPREVFGKVECPTLATYGELDRVVPAKINQAEMEAIFRENDNAEVTTQFIPKANHFYMEAQTGAPEEISQLEKAFVPGFLEVVRDWILRKN
jgi:pimeloyl-ACP methyl ester carboxylesterase